MKRSFLEAITNRRSIYDISNKSTITDSEIEDILSTVLMQTPSAFNSQSCRVVLLLGDNHLRLWDIVLEKLKEVTNAESFSNAKEKIDKSFKSGYATILYFVDSDVVKNMQEMFPAYSHNFPIWSHQASGMTQFSIWTALEDAGMGASLQHYGNLIEDAVKKEWDLPESWNIIAEMPFGEPISETEKSSRLPLDGRLFIKK